jgi:hypothetical protein
MCNLENFNLLSSKYHAEHIKQNSSNVKEDRFDR